MKKIIFSIISFFSVSAYSQVAIGKASVSSGAVSLEFGNADKGMVLPWVDSAASISGAENGTMIYDISDHKVKVMLSTGWKDLSIDSTGTTIDPITNIDGVAIQNSLTENIGAKVEIGTGVPSSTSGILVLKDTNKAMILPKMASPHLNIINPAPGLMVYDTTAKQLAIFNGKVWTFWK